MTDSGLTFQEHNERNPCVGCSAPCCQVISIPYKVPATFMDFDYVRYLLNFPRLEIAVARAGEWSILLREICSHFDQQARACQVHGTAEQPMTCRYYNPHQCWYKPNLASAEPQSIYILTRETFPHWLQQVRFAEQGEVISIPDFEASRQLLRDIKEAQPVSGAEVVPMPGHSTATASVLPILTTQTVNR